MIGLLRWLLLPISLLYGCVVWLRNFLYDRGIWHSKSYPVRSIVIGNLAVGGSGKTPMTECLIRWFNSDYKIATLSRGYGRKTKGFRYVQIDDSAIATGDEPLQFKRKFPQLTVAVCEDRRTGIETLLSEHNLILLDDAYQHRRVAASCNILLFEYASLLGPIIPLPTGNFRDILPQAKRAHIIVITKIPKDLSVHQRAAIIKRLRKHSDAPIYFASIAYGAPKALSRPNDMTTNSSLVELRDKHVLLVTGIANPTPLIDYVRQQAQSVRNIALPDHHVFTPTDYEQIQVSYTQLASQGDTILITTEKDVQRLSIHSLASIPCYYIPITFVFDEEDHIRQDVINTLARYSVNEP
ncbi:tetraacyldisaccharide 4'-kinase [Sphingobacterium sp. lm-10]|uniref:tetraacyldisaccharide 4'-kinase n=1 Tax=Sphingobacterium sp. lm-10 TaxID=2944904 RepID=UPI00201FE186|nr:tetraacyldisaccharide 4'-kinase [Sphingobacterium sp. lm-10]MCL7988444.1 tetraacyldisaccharide 4'-kinase [Sphingobacterium sp. lm-10]